MTRVLRLDRRQALGGLAALLARPAWAAPAPLQVEVDSHIAPDLAGWAQGLAVQCQGWWPRILEILPSPGFVPPDRIQIAQQARTFHEYVGQARRSELDGEERLLLLAGDGTSLLM